MSFFPRLASDPVPKKPTAILVIPYAEAGSFDNEPSYPGGRAIMLARVKERSVILTGAPADGFVCDRPEAGRVVFGLETQDPDVEFIGEPK